MGDIVYAAPFAWDAQKEEHIYCTDGLEDYNLIDIWRYPTPLLSLQPSPRDCQVSCCASYETVECTAGANGGSTCFGGCPGLYQTGGGSSTYFSVQKTYEDGDYCCPDAGLCPYGSVQKIIGTFQVYLASSTQDEWIKIGGLTNVNVTEQIFEAYSELEQAVRLPANYKSILIDTIDVKNGAPKHKESFKGGPCSAAFPYVQRPDEIFPYEGLFGATGISISESVRADQLLRNRDNDIGPTSYGLYFIAVGDLTWTMHDLCGREEPYDEIRPPQGVQAGIREHRLGLDRSLACTNQVPPGSDCNTPGTMYPNDPLLLGASGPSGNFRERALFSAAIKGCFFEVQSVAPGSTFLSERKFINPWTGKQENAEEYVFKVYSGV
jgi:hypothetical protein